jgi:hypothetical protein
MWVTPPPFRAAAIVPLIHSTKSVMSIFLSKWFRANTARHTPPKTRNGAVRASYPCRSHRDINYPGVAIMKWRGHDDTRSEGTKRFLEASLEGIGLGRDQSNGEFAATQRVLPERGRSGGEGAGRGGQGIGSPHSTDIQQRAQRMARDARRYDKGGR